MSQPPPGAPPFSRQCLAAFRDLHAVLARTTTVLRVSPSLQQLTGHQLHDFLGTVLYDLVHDDDAQVLLEELDHAASIPGHVVRFHARIRTAFISPLYAAFDIRGHFHHLPSTSLLAEPIPVGVFVLVARPAFLSSSIQMDRFLELKSDELVLLRRIAKLRADEDDDYAHEPNACYDLDTFQKSIADGLLDGFTAREQASLGVATRYGGHVVINGDLGIPFKNTKHPTKPSKRAKVSKADLICTWCSATDAPEWRHGPAGPKTLCNACGLKYSKSRRKPLSAASESDCASRSDYAISSHE